MIAVAGADVAGPTGDRLADEAELALLGVVAFTDPIRVGVAQALAECREAGIRVVMITGDHPATAHAVAEGLGLPHQGPEGDLIATGTPSGVGYARTPPVFMKPGDEIVIEIDGVGRGFDMLDSRLSNLKTSAGVFIAKVAA